MRAALFLAGAAALVLTAAAPAGRPVAGPPSCRSTSQIEVDVGSFVQLTTCTPFFRSSTSYLPARFRVTAGSLPPGLLLQGNDGVAAQLSGTPTTVGTYTFTIGAQNALGGRASGRYTVQVFPRLVFTGTELPRGVMGLPYSATISASGGDPPYTYGPFSQNGVSLDASTGLLAGTIQPATPANGIPGLVCGLAIDVTDASGARTTATFDMEVFDQSGDGPYVAACALELQPFVYVTGVTPRRAVIPASIGKQPAFVPAEPVKITGRDLGDVTGVTFAGRAASFTLESDGGLTAFPPVGTKSGPIVLTSYDGRTWRAGNFTVTRPG